ncbi:Ribosomal large subunit pseudouridine synthase F [sediment metagenome]|uniref:Ribosomal large subunit pseudouridine synthase F n=1 Tax=sediment metagenome TaxID=749907 RepID=D9PFC4_9ZZZZ
MNNKIEYPIRINRYLFLKNICSRREADRLIEKKLITVNGNKAIIGQQIQKNDKVEIKKIGKDKLSKKQIILFNKPIGVVSHNPQFGEKEPNDFLPFTEKLSPIGRLDKMSHGLMIMSDDGRLVDKMLNPKFEHQKEYLVSVDKKITPNFIKQMSQGIDIGDYITKPAKIEKENNKSFYIILTEGKKHQIRRMCSTIGFTVLDLERIRMMNIKLGDLEEGQ